MKNETRYEGVRFGSGQFMTAQVWHLLGSAAGGKPDWKRVAYREAYANGCPRPKANIEKNGVKENAQVDGRNNFLFRYIVSKAKDIPNRSLYNALVYGWDKNVSGRVEKKHVPTSYWKKGIRRGFARDLPYEVTSRFWRAKESGKNIYSLLDGLDKAIQRSDTLHELASNFITSS